MLEVKKVLNLIKLPDPLKLYRLLRSYGYEVAFQSDNDSLYLHKDAELKNRNYKN
jgi:hypothetical protein